MDISEVMIMLAVWSVGRPERFRLVGRRVRWREEDLESLLAAWLVCFVVGMFRLVGHRGRFGEAHLLGA